MSASESQGRGCLFVATGKDAFLREAIYNARQVSKYMPGLPIALCTELTTKRPKPFSQLIHLDDGTANAHKLKARSLLLSPFEQTLFLDTDAFVQAPLWELFSLLEEADICIAKDCDVDWNQTWELKSLSGGAHYNTGVFAYRRSPACNAFLKLLQDLICEHDDADMWAGHFGDQHFFNHILESGRPEAKALRLTPIPNTVYNVRPWMEDEMRRQGLLKQAKILHMRTAMTGPLTANKCLPRLKTKLALRTRLKRLLRRGAA